MSEVFEVPEGWKIEPLSNCSTITNSNVDKKYIDDELEIKLCNYMDVYVNEEIDKSVNFMTATATTLEIEKFELKQNDVIITKDSESPDDIAIPTYIKEDLPNVLCGYHLTLLRPKMKCNGKFLAIALQSSRYKKYFGALASGSTRFALSLGVISNTPILLPPLKEQQKIAKILSTLDSAIEASQKLIAKEKNIKKGLMYDLLTNGIDKNGNIRSPKTHQYRESELGLIPVEWKINVINKIGEVITGTTPSTDVEGYYNGNIPFIGPVDFYGQVYIINTEKTVSESGLEQSRKIPPNSILTVCIGSTIGKMSLTTQESCTNQQINSLVCDSAYDYKFIFYVMKLYLSKQLNVEAGLQAVPLVNKTSFSKLLLPCPNTKEEQQKIATILTEQDKKIETEEKNLEKLKELKKGLMHDLLSGKVRVKA